MHHSGSDTVPALVSVTALHPCVRQAPFSRRAHNNIHCTFTNLKEQISVSAASSFRLAPSNSFRSRAISCSYRALSLLLLLFPLLLLLLALAPLLLLLLACGIGIIGGGCASPAEPRFLSIFWAFNQSTNQSSNQSTNQSL
jgi:hypothetical protein